MTVLKGKKISLRPVMLADAAKLFVWINNPEVTRNLNAYLPMYEKDEEEWVANMHKRKETDLVFGITLNGVLIGVTGLHQINQRDRTALFGIFIGEKEEWGKGYGTEVLRLIIEYAFDTLNLRKLWLHVFASNKRGRQCYTRCGFRKEGILKAHVYKTGQYEDVITMALFRKGSGG